MDGGNLNAEEIRSLKLQTEEWDGVTYAPDIRIAEFLIMREIAAQLAELNAAVDRVFTRNGFRTVPLDKL
jgi:hypothetical protein